MPIYEYQCENTNCVKSGVKIERLQKISDQALLVCPECSSESLRKLVSAAGFRLKGGGWYETDFKNSTDKKKNLSGDDSSPVATSSKAAESASSSSQPAGSSATQSAAATTAGSSPAATSNSETTKS